MCIICLQELFISTGTMTQQKIKNTPIIIKKTDSTSSSKFCIHSFIYFFYQIVIVYINNTPNTASLTKVTLNKEINDTKKLCLTNLSYFEHFL